MSSVLETLKVRLAQKQERYKDLTPRLQSMYADLTAITQKYATSHAEYVALKQDIDSYQKVVESETRLVDAEKILEQLDAAAVLATETPEQSPAVSEAPQEQTIEPLEDGGEINKTALVREALQKSPGLTPGEVWTAVKDQIPRRNYVYAILGRLKDRKQVDVRRGKYYFKITATKPEGHNANQQILPIQ